MALGSRTVIVGLLAVGGLALLGSIASAKAKKPAGGGGSGSGQGGGGIDATACAGYQSALANLQSHKSNLQGDLVDIDAARIELAQNGQDTSALDAQRQTIVNAIASVNAQISDVQGKIAVACG